jgi:uncharacterized PurR-regulated membrane protein YhhQ (DUF165 family)
VTRLLYVVAFVAANVITAATEPASIGPWLVTWGTWVVGFSFILRDRLHLLYGRRGVYGMLALGVVLAGATSWLLGDTLLVLAGSCLALLLSEAADTEVFARLHARLGLRVAASGVVGSAIDSVVFCVVGLGLSGIVPWALIPNVIVGQFVVKSALQLLAGAAVVRWPRLVMV